VKVGDLVRSRHESRPESVKIYPHLEEIGIVVGWEGSHPIVLYPSERLTQAKSMLKVVNTSLLSSNRSYSSYVGNEPRSKEDT